MTASSTHLPLYRGIDEAFTTLLSDAPEDRRWLLIQTIATAASRRALLQSLPWGEGADVVLDVGCGFGAAAMEVAALRPSTQVTGVDADRPVLARARTAGAAAGLVAPGRVSFVEGDAYCLPFADGSVDAAMSRFVFQHLADPAAAAAETARVLRPGGIACVVDVDDGLSLSHPPESAAFERLSAALRSAQSSYGGDRRIGRRLAGLLDSQGLEPVSVLVLPQASYRRPGPGDPERALLLERLRAARKAIVGGGFMSSADFDTDLSALAEEEPGPVCEVEAHLAVVARRR